MLFMGAIVAASPTATEGIKSADRFQGQEDLERVGKMVAIACLAAAIESFIAARRKSRAWLAEDLCGIPEANFSKIANGVQGDFWWLVYKLPADIRSDFFDRLRESEKVDPLKVAERLIATAFQLLRVTGLRLPEHQRMAHAGLPERKRKSA